MNRHPTETDGQRHLKTFASHNHGREEDVFPSSGTGVISPDLSPEIKVVWSFRMFHRPDMEVLNAFTRSKPKNVEVGPSRSNIELVLEPRHAMRISVQRVSKTVRRDLPKIPGH